MTKTESKISRRVFFETLLSEYELRTDLVEFAEGELAKLEAEAEKRRAATAKKAEEFEPIKAQLLELLEELPRSTADLAKEVGISTPRATSLLRKLVDEGKAVAHDFKPTGKGRTVKGYTRV